MNNLLPGFDPMLWRYLAASYGNVFFCGCDDFSHPPIVDYLIKMKFDLIRWQAAADFDDNRQCIYRTLKGGFYLRQPIPNIATILSLFYREDPILTEVFKAPLFGNAKGEYGYDEVFTSRFFYPKFASNMATILLKMDQPCYLFDTLDMPYLRSVNPRSTLIYANA